MRHLGSLIVAAVFAPSILILAGRGLRWFTDATTADLADELAMLFALAALSLAGILYALLTLPRFSPLGPMLAGGAYLGVGVWALTDLRHLLATVPGELAGLDAAAVTTTAAVSPLLAAPLLATAFSARRWRGDRAEVAGAPPVAPAGAAPPAARPTPRPVPYRPQPTREMPTATLPTAADATLDAGAGTGSDQPTEPIEPVTDGPASRDPAGRASPRPATADRTAPGPATPGPAAPQPSPARAAGPAG